MSSNTLRVIVTLLLLLSATASRCPRLASAAPGATRSWIAIDASCSRKALVEGDRWEVPVDYYLAPNENDGGTTLYVWVAGPFIDTPDGKYTTRREHVSYGADLSRSVKVAPGRGRQVFTFTVPPALPHNSLLLIAYFRDKAGNRRPWEMRRGGIGFRRRGGFFELETEKPGNLFLYQETVRLIARLKNVKEIGTKKTLAYRVRDVTGDVVARGEVAFTVEKDGQEVPIHLDLARRGTFLIEADVAGWESRETSFCRIPDVLAITHGAPTRFGMTLPATSGPWPRKQFEERCEIARRLGLTTCRFMHSWSELEPGPGVYQLDAWQETFDSFRRHGIEPYLCIFDPPAWALEGGAGASSYRTFRCDLNAWREFVTTTTARFRGRLRGWEWLNEITPGGTERFVDDYVALCRTGAQEARSVDPGIVTVLAGGLWPRSFRTTVLAANAGATVDVLPVHYSNGGGVREAREDLDAAGLKKVAVWDDETAKGVNTWNVPAREQLQDTRQSEWVLSQWTDELAAGCEKLIYFGGTGTAAGTYDYMLDDLSPRPVAATLAVLTAKLSGARPLGSFTLGRAGLFHLFDRAGKPLLVCSSYEPGESVPLNVGTGRIRKTDYQGNETEIPAPGGAAQLALGPMPYYLEGADLDVLKAYVTSEIATPQAALKRSRLAEIPRVTLLQGSVGQLSVRLRNLYGRDLSGRLRIGVPAGWPAPKEIPFSLRRGEEKIVPVSLRPPADATAKDYEVAATVRFAWSKLPRIEKPAVLSVISPAMLGNLMPNGDLETPDPRGSGPMGWRVNGQTSFWASAAGLGMSEAGALGTHVLKFEGSPNGYVTASQSLALRGGQTYLYTAWVWNRNMKAGSNIVQRLADGTTRSLYDVQVFTCGEDNSYWQMYTARYQSPSDLQSVSFAPLALGAGSALFDNIRVTLFEGTDYAAECYPAPRPPRIDGRLDDWVTACPVPLIGQNQLTLLDRSYAWSPANLNGIGYLMWDDENLYVALVVRDDTHHAERTGDAATEDDSVILAFDPTHRGPQAASRSSAYYLSSAPPAGGSGRYTLFRPARYAAGRPSGQLLKDSSVYDMAVTTGEGTCTYELRIPLRELGVAAPAVGTKVGFSIQLNDNDDRGVATRMNWGGGISPAWQPADFGVLTFVGSPDAARR